MPVKALDIVVSAQDKASTVFDKIGAGLKNLKRATGEESTFGGLAKIAAGTGAVAGLALSGRLLDQFAQKAAELKQQFNDGSKSAGQVGEELAKSLPIFGEIISAGRTFRGLIDGTADDLARLARQDSLGKILDNTAAALQGLKKIREEGEDAARHVRQQTGLVGLVDPAKTLQQLRDEREETVRLIAKNKEDIAKQTKEQSSKDVSDLQKAAQAAASRTGEARAKYEYGLKAYGESDQYTIGRREDLNTAIADQSAAELALRQKALVLKQETAAKIGAANNQLSEKLNLNDKQRAVVQDAANQERERRELSHWTTIGQIRLKAQQEALRNQGDTTGATIAGQQEQYRQTTAAAAQQFREGLREAMHGGPDSPAKVLANFLQEGFARRGEYDADIRRTVAGSIGQSLLDGFNDATDFVKGKLDNWPKKLLSAAGLSGVANFNEAVPAVTGPTTAPLLESRFATGVGSVDRVNRDQLAEQKKHTALLTRIAEYLDVNVGDEPSAVYNGS